MGNVPVYNVSMSLLQRLGSPAPFRVVELATDGRIAGRPDGTGAADGRMERREQADRRTAPAGATRNSDGAGI